jgi:hypothetical protein
LDPQKHIYEDDLASQSSKKKQSDLLKMILSMMNGEGKSDEVRRSELRDKLERAMQRRKFF